MTTTTTLTSCEHACDYCGTEDSECRTIKKISGDSRFLTHKSQVRICDVCFNHMKQVGEIRKYDGNYIFMVDALSEAKF